MKLASETLRYCRQKGLTLATAESCTGGMLGAALTDIAGSSDVFERGFITYSNIAKTEMLGVDAMVLQQFGAVSQQVAAQMAQGALNNSNANIAISVTGVAGPGADGSKPEGLVWFGLAQNSKPVQSFKQEFGILGRAAVREASVKFALLKILGTGS